MTRNANLFTWDEISPHFTKKEILSPETMNHPYLVDVTALYCLNKLRERIGEPLFCNRPDLGLTLRGVRSPKEQIRLRDRYPGAATLSMHVQGKAFDISGYEPELLLELEKLAPECGFTFSLMYLTFIHLDIRQALL